MDIDYYVTDSGQSPFVKWFDALEAKSQVAVMRYVRRVSLGGSRKNVESLGHGVWEIKLSYKGLRIYFAKYDDRVLLLLGGSKSSQARDIELAKDCWRKYGEEK
ncbi:MAG: type II toxin-antitoxin system RelE/ParE family toxin [Pseudomonadota bacterium]|nr:type II toxin-antitoxin system RelE/ParE family toxin [Pseudomonadota bacterium]